jgi:hypothetical protein
LENDRINDAAIAIAAPDQEAPFSSLRINFRTDALAFQNRNRRSTAPNEPA